MDAQGRVVEYSFDAPEVELVVLNKPPMKIVAVEAKTGGPHGIAPIRRR